MTTAETRHEAADFELALALVEDYNFPRFPVRARAIGDDSDPEVYADEVSLYYGLDLLFDGTGKIEQAPVRVELWGVPRTPKPEEEIESIYVWEIAKLPPG